MFQHGNRRSKDGRLPKAKNNHVTLIRRHLPQKRPLPLAYHLRIITDRLIHPPCISSISRALELTTITHTRSKMAANTRYEPAPQRDSFEDQHYTQPPPSYQATDSGHEPAPRSEDDNLPDDFKVGFLPYMVDRCIGW